MEITVKQLADRIDAELVGGGSGQITSVNPVEACSENDLTFLVNEKLLALLRKSKAGAVITNKLLDNYPGSQLIVENVDTALIKTLKIFAPELKPAIKGIDPTSKIGQNVEMSENVSIGPNVVIDDSVRIGKNSVITAGCKIGENSKVGDNCKLDSNVVIYHNCRIGSNVIIQANTTIGATGFGYSFVDGGHRLIPHNGGVVIEDFVEIGANSCIDRAKFGNTIIGAGTKIDNLVQIAHNVVIGKCCLIVAQVGISGSCRIGDGVVLAGHVGLADNIELGDGVIVGARSGVMNDIPAGKKVFGAPAVEYKEEIRLMLLRSRLPEMAKKLKQLSSRIDSLEASKDDKK